MSNSKSKTTVSTLMALCLSLVLSIALIPVAPAARDDAYAASSSPEYIAVLGIDRWAEADGSPHLEGSDLTALVRVDAAGGTVSILSIPRDMYYDNTQIDENATSMKANYAFYYGFHKVIDDEWTNYGDAVAAGAKATLKMIKATTGIKVKKWAAVDLYTYQEVVDALGGVNVNIPLAIKNYQFYNNRGTYVDVNDGKTGEATLDGEAAMIAARARTVYGTTDIATGEALHYYSKKSKYKGDYPELLMKMVNSKGGTYYAFDQDGVRQFLNRRVLTNLIVKGLAKGSKTASFVWNTLISTNLIYTNYSKAEAKALAKAMVKTKSKLLVNGASLAAPDGGQEEINGLTQFLIRPDESKVKAVVKQFKKGKLMTKGWGAETTYGIATGATAKVKSTTYKATSATAVSVKKAANKKSVSIPAKVTINGKSYKVTATAAKAFKGSKIRTVTLGKNIKTIAKSTFKGSKATKIVLKTTKLKKKTVAGSLKGAKASTIKIKAPSKKYKSKYKTYFKKSNSGKTVKFL